jgi:hypothetical protein
VPWDTTIILKSHLARNSACKRGQFKRRKNTRMLLISQMGTAFAAGAACREILAMLIWPIFFPDADAGTALAAAMQLVSGTDALIVDLRRNCGGSGETATALLSYFFEEPIQLSSIVERKNGQPVERQRWTMPYVAGPRYAGKPVFVLTSRRTHSAAELCAYDLKNTHRATIVGERTAGGRKFKHG